MKLIPSIQIDNMARVLIFDDVNETTHNWESTIVISLLSIRPNHLRWECSSMDIIGANDGNSNVFGFGLEKE